MKTIYQSSRYRVSVKDLYEAVEDYLTRIKLLIKFKKLEIKVRKFEDSTGLKIMPELNNNVPYKCHVKSLTSSA